MRKTNRRGNDVGLTTEEGNRIEGHDPLLQHGLLFQGPSKAAWLMSLSNLGIAILCISPFTRRPTSVATGTQFFSHKNSPPIFGKFAVPRHGAKPPKISLPSFLADFGGSSGEFFGKGVLGGGG